MSACDMNLAIGENFLCCSATNLSDISAYSIVVLILLCPMMRRRENTSPPLRHVLRTEGMTQRVRTYFRQLEASATHLSSHYRLQAPSPKITSMASAALPDPSLIALSANQIEYSRRYWHHSITCLA